MPSTRHDITVIHRRAQVAQRYLRGQQQYEIGRVLQISQAQVSHDLHHVRKEWLASAIRDFDAIKAEQLAKIDAIERAAFEGWERSLQPREITLTEAIEGGETPRRKASMRKEGQAGDPRFLQTIQKCIDQRCAILGLGEEQASLKAASLGMASLLDQARQFQGLPTPRSAPLAEA